MVAIILEIRVLGWWSVMVILHGKRGFKPSRMILAHESVIVAFFIIHIDISVVVIVIANVGVVPWNASSQTRAH